MAIICPKCGGKVKTIDSRMIKNINTQFRKKECLDCGCRFKTLESIVEGSSYYPRKTRAQQPDPPVTLEEMEDLHAKFGLM